MKKRRIIVIMLLTVLCCGLVVGLAGCPPLPNYFGVTVYGLDTNGVSEVALKSVNYQFNIVDFPDVDYYNYGKSDSYISIAYNFYNSTLNDVTVPLYLTLATPSYYEEKLDFSRYVFETTATQNVTLRCAFRQELRYSYDSFTGENVSVQEFLKHIYDEKQYSDNYNSESPVYKYTYEITDLNSDVDTLRYTCNDVGDKNVFVDRLIYMTETGSDNSKSYYINIGTSQEITFYSLNKELSDIESKTVFYDGSSEKIVNDGGKLTLKSSDVVTYDELAMTYYNEQSNCTEVDWYNAVLMNILRDDSDNADSVRSLKYFDMSDNLAYMYQCNLVAPAQSEVKQTVRIPLFPTVDKYSYDKDVYDYNLDLSSLSRWRGKPNVSVSIVTDGYYVKSSKELTSADNGFALTQINPSVNTLSFTLCETADFTKTDNSSSSEAGKRVGIAFLVFGVIIVLIPTVTVSIVIGLDRAKRKKKIKAEQESTATDEKTNKF